MLDHLFNYDDDDYYYCYCDFSYDVRPDCLHVKLLLL